MIAAAINQIAKELNQSLGDVQNPGPPSAVVCSPLGPDGAPSPEAAEKLLVFLVNIERDPGISRAARWSGAAGGRIGLTPPPVNLNLLVMVAANYGGTKYGAALELLSRTLKVFQSRPVIDHHNAPDLDGGIERLVLELEDLSVTDLSNLWGVLGGHYMPSVLYRVRMITIDSHKLTAQVPTVRDPELGVNPRLVPESPAA